VLTYSSRFNSVLAGIRKETLSGVYDIHTNVIQYPSIVQPTHARWERADQDTDIKAITNGINGHSISSKELTLPKLESVYTRNFRIHDLCLESAPDSLLGPPGLDDDPTSLTNIPRDVLDELPQECRAAFDEARSRVIDWKSKWLTEATDGMRARFTPSMAWTG
jgi:chromatin structure-remodeling complex protein RSC7